MNETVARWWLSWYEPMPDEDYRPTTWPLPPAVLGYWCSGFTMDDPPCATLIAWVEAPTEEGAWSIALACWPAGEKRRRFCERKDEAPTGGRFPRPDWAAGRWPGGGAS